LKTLNIVKCLSRKVLNFIYNAAVVEGSNYNFQDPLIAGMKKNQIWIWYKWKRKYRKCWTNFDN